MGIDHGVVLGSGRADSRDEAAVAGDDDSRSRFKTWDIDRSTIYAASDFLLFGRSKTSFPVRGKVWMGGSNVSGESEFSMMLTSYAIVARSVLRKIIVVSSRISWSLEGIYAK